MTAREMTERRGCPPTCAKGGWGPTTEDPDASDDGEAARRPVTRAEWLAFHVARAPRITARQWADTLLLLQARDEDSDEGHTRKAG
jgi:hypothetical protein